MSGEQLTVLSVGATGSVGGYVIDEAISQGHTVRALLRNPAQLKPRLNLDIVTGDLTRPQSLVEAVKGVDAVVFTHGTYGSSTQAEAVDYSGVRHVLEALDHKDIRIALMTAIAVTDRKGAHDWKRRAEWLVRASGNPYTIVRPGWFDYNEAEQHRPVFLQGDRRQSGTPRDGVISRRQVAQVLVRSLTSVPALRKTFELVAEHGPAPDNFDPLFAALETDEVGHRNAIQDADNMPLEREAPDFVTLLDTFRSRWDATTGSSASYRST